MRNEYASMEIDHFFAFFFFQLSCFLAGHFLSIFFNTRLFTCLLLLRVHKVGVMVKQVFKQFLHDCVIWLEIITTNGFIVCYDSVLLTICIGHSFFGATEKEMKPLVLKLIVLGTWVFQLRAKTKAPSMNSISRKNYHHSLGNVQVVLSWFGVNLLLAPLLIKFYLFSSPELLP